MKKILKGIILSVLTICFASILLACGPSECIVSFDLNGGVGAADVIKTAKGKTINSPVTPTFDGKFFDGWWTAKEGGDKWVFSKNKVKKDMTLFARWNNAGVTVSFDINSPIGAEIKNAPEDMHLALNTYAVKPNNPTCDAFEFKGWFLEKDGINAVDFTEFVLTESLTLYAKWSALLKLEFDVNHPTAKLETSVQLVEMGSAPRAENVDEIDELRFVGWYSEREGLKAFSFISPMTKNTKVYGKWLMPSSEAVFKTQLRMEHIGYESKEVLIVTGFESNNLTEIVFPKTINGQNIYEVDFYDFGDNEIEKIYLNNNLKKMRLFSLINSFPKLKDVAIMGYGGMYTYDNGMIFEGSEKEYDLIFMSRQHSGIVDIPAYVAKSSAIFHKEVTALKLNKIINVEYNIPRFMDDALYELFISSGNFDTNVFRLSSLVGGQFVIENNVLLKVIGASKEVNIPQGVVKVNSTAIAIDEITQIRFPESVADAEYLFYNYMYGMKVLIFDGEEPPVLGNVSDHLLLNIYVPSEKAKLAYKKVFKGNNMTVKLISEMV